MTRNTGSDERRRSGSHRRRQRPIEAVGTVEEIDGDKYITVRKYRLLEDENSWDEDEG